MSERSNGARGVWRRALAALLVTATLAPAVAGPLDVPVSAEPRVPVATAVQAYGLLSSRAAGERWERLYHKDKVHSRDLVVCLPGLRSKLEPRPDSVELTLWGNLPQLSRSPVLESAVVLHDSSAYDLDFTLLRGRVVLTNKKKKGPARIWLRVLKGVGLTLAEPGDSVALELYGRWPAGAPFQLKAPPGHAPIRVWDVNVLKGRLDVKADKTEFAMEFPGPAYYHGDSVGGPAEGGPQRRSTLPAWADPTAPQPPELETIKSLLTVYKDRLKGKDVDEAAIEMLAASAKEKDHARAAMMRELVVCALAALDDIDRVIDALDNPRHADMRHSAIIGLRHWIGLGPGRDEVLYERLVGEFGYSKAQAATVMQLLHSPFAANQPETYETLIAYLKHSKLAVRELAFWHLRRLAPSCRDLTYNAGAPEAERNREAEAWRKRIPSGELPPPPKKKEPKKKE
jgi:hypothetical protein